MKISNFFSLFVAASAQLHSVTAEANQTQVSQLNQQRGLTTDDEKVLHEDPIARLNQLVRFSDGLIDDWFGFLRSQRKWKSKLDINAMRMKDAYIRCGHYDNTIDYAGKFKVPVSSMAKDAQFVPLLSGMAAKQVEAVHLKVKGAFNSPVRFALSPEDANGGPKYQISLGDSSGTKSTISFCDEYGDCAELASKRHTKRKFKSWTSLFLRFGDGHIVVYYGNTQVEILSSYSNQISRLEAKMLSLSATDKTDKGYSATVLNILYDKKAAEELPKKVYTPNRYNYQPVVNKLSAKKIKSVELRFPDVKNDAIIGLASEPTHNAPKWEIVLGAYQGTQSLIRPCNKCKFVARVSHSRDQFKQWSSKGIKLSLANGRICVYDNNNKKIIEYTDKGISKGKMKYLMVTTGWGSSGMWTVTDLEFEQKRVRREVEAAYEGEHDLEYEYEGDYEHSYDESYLYEYPAETDNSNNANNGTMLNDYPNVNLKFNQPEQSEETEEEIEMRIDSSNPFKSINQITSGFQKWSQRFLSNCRGQQKRLHQMKRMEKWNRLLQDHLAGFMEADQ